MNTVLSWLIMHIETGNTIQNNRRILDGASDVSFVVNNRTVFEVSIGKDGKSIEIRSIDYVKIDGVVYDHLKVSVRPVAANCVTMSLLPYQE